MFKYTQQLTKACGVKTTEAFLRLALGEQPDELAKRRLLESPVSIYLHQRADGSLAMIDTNRRIAASISSFALMPLS
jgi:hypothetical protein